jgi:hypothetical protein
VQHLRTFGCIVHVKKLGPGLHKLADRSTPGIFVGYNLQGGRKGLPPRQAHLCHVGRGLQGTLRLELGRVR